LPKRFGVQAQRVATTKFFSRKDTPKRIQMQKKIWRLSNLLRRRGGDRPYS